MEAVMISSLKSSARVGFASAMGHLAFIETAFEPLEESWHPDERERARTDEEGNLQIGCKDVPGDRFSCLVVVGEVAQGRRHAENKKLGATDGVGRVNENHRVSKGQRGKRKGSAGQLGPWG